MNTISREEIRTLSGGGSRDTMLINVLDQDHFDKEHIPGSMNVPLSDANFLSRVEEMSGGKDQDIVVYCASKDCPASRQAAEKLTAAGFTRVRAYEGGIKDWRMAGMPIDAGVGASSNG
jgi:rhodanese-related sulfurtransferase